MQSAKVADAEARREEGSASIRITHKKARPESVQVIKNESQFTSAQLIRITICFPCEFLGNTNVRMKFAAEVRTMTSSFSQIAKDRLQSHRYAKAFRITSHWRSATCFSRDPKSQ